MTRRTGSDGEEEHQGDRTGLPLGDDRPAWLEMPARDAPPPDIYTYVDGSFAPAARCEQCSFTFPAPIRLGPGTYRFYRNRIGFRSDGCPKCGHAWASVVDATIQIRTDVVDFARSDPARSLPILDEVLRALEESKRRVDQGSEDATVVAADFEARLQRLEAEGLPARLKKSLEPQNPAHWMIYIGAVIAFIGYLTGTSPAEWRDWTIEQIDEALGEATQSPLQAPQTPPPTSEPPPPGTGTP